MFWKTGHFLIKYGLESSVFFREWMFTWQKMGMRELIFPWKIGKKRTSYWVFNPWYVVLTEFTFFYLIWTWQQRVFHVKVEKNDMRAQWFWEIGRFFHKIWAWAQSVFREWTSFWNMGITAAIFSWKSGKKGILLTFLSQNSGVFLKELTFVDEIFACKH